MIFLAALIGFGLGHLVNLVFERFYRGAAIAGPIYECPACRAPINPLSMIPYASVVLSAGRCAHCRERLPWRTVILPAGAAGLFALSYLAFDDFWAALLGGFFGTIFLTLTLTDLERRVLPNRIVYPAIVLAVALCWAWPETSAIQVLAGGVVGIAIAALLYLFSLFFGPEAFGMGDVKMIVLIGFVVGFPGVIAAVFLGTVAAGAVAAVLVVTRIRGLRDYVPHGPFLALGAMFALYAGA